MRKYLKACHVDPATPLPLLPETFVLTVAGGKSSGDGDKSGSIAEVDALAKSHSEHGLKADFELRGFSEAAAAAEARGDGTMWIVKPPPLNRGRGIHVFGTPKAAEAFLRQRKPGSVWAVQK